MLSASRVSFYQSKTDMGETVRLPVVVAVSSDHGFPSLGWNGIKEQRGCYILLMGNKDAGKQDFLFSMSVIPRISKIGKGCAGWDYQAMIIADIAYELYDYTAQEQWTELPADYPKMKFVLIFGDNADEILHWTNMLEKGTKNLNLYSLQYAKHEDAIIQTLSPFDKDSIKAPTKVSKKEALAIANQLLPHVLLSNLEMQNRDAVPRQTKKMS